MTIGVVGLGLVWWLIDLGIWYILYITYRLVPIQYLGMGVVQYTKAIDYIKVIWDMSKLAMNEELKNDEI